MIAGQIRTLFPQTKITSVGVQDVLTFRIEQFGESQVLLGQVEGVLQVVVNVGLLQLVEVHKVWPETNIEGKNVRITP